MTDSADATATLTIWDEDPQTALQILDQWEPTTMEHSAEFRNLLERGLYVDSRGILIFPSAPALLCYMHGLTPAGSFMTPVATLATPFN